MQQLTGAGYRGDSAASFRHDAPAKVGVLLCNLGTPDAPTPPAVRRYLAEFLADPRLIELPRWLWLPILHGVILNVRPRRSAHAYAKVWTPEGSPLRVISEQQCSALRARLTERVGPRVDVALAMRYGHPSIAQALDTLRAAQVRQLVVLPLYPQYSGPATGSVFDAVARVLMGFRWVPDLRFISSYHAEPAYLDAVAASLRAHWAVHPPGERLLFSFHGLPYKCLTEGDPYFCHCHATARAVAARLGLDDARWQVVFQSRFGGARWLEPYADVTLRQLPTQGVKSVDIVCPGFAADCLETLEEIALQNREVFLRAGGERYAYVPALNASELHIAALGDLVERNLVGWDAKPSAELVATRARAIERGAAG